MNGAFTAPALITVISAECAFSASIDAAVNIHLIIVRSFESASSPTGKIPACK